MMIADKLSQELNIKISQAESVIKLIDDGNTIPFIARYRKEATGSLDDDILRKFDERLRYLRNLEEKKETVLKSIEEQGKLTEEMKKSIEDCMTLVELEDLYRPYKPKRRTRATIAKEKGLEELANIILAQEIEVPVEEIAKEYIPLSNSKSVGQVLHYPYDFEKTKIVLREMIDDLTLYLVSRKLVTNQVVLTVGYDISSLDNYDGEIKVDYYGRNIPKQAHGTVNINHKTYIKCIVIQRSAFIAQIILMS